MFIINQMLANSADLTVSMSLYIISVSEISLSLCLLSLVLWNKSPLKSQTGSFDKNVKHLGVFMLLIFPNNGSTQKLIAEQKRFLTTSEDCHGFQKSKGKILLCCWFKGHHFKLF